MTADEYDTGEKYSPTNRPRSREIFVVGGDEGDRVALAGASSEGLDADRSFDIHQQVGTFGTADETPNFTRPEAMRHV